MFYTLKGMNGSNYTFDLCKIETIRYGMNTCHNLIITFNSFNNNYIETSCSENEYNKLMKYFKEMYQFSMINN